MAAAYYNALGAMASNLTNPEVSRTLLGSSIDQALYAGTDIASLSLLEKWWAAWYLWIDDPVYATGIMAFFLHEFVYFGRCVPWIIIDRIPYFRKWKLQEGKMPSAADQWKATKSVLLTHFTVELPQIWAFYPIATYTGMACHQVPFPSFWTMFYQIAIFFVIEDTWHYWAHRALHEYPTLYKMIHKQHHEFSAPFGLAAEYAHPLEIIILAVGTIGGPLAWCMLSGGNCHLITVYTWIVLRLWQAVDAHSGYDFPWSLRKFIPFWSGADHHDFHHMNFLGCYSTSFRWWDHFMGTDKSYQAYKQRKVEHAKAGKGSITPWVPGAKEREQATLAQAKKTV